MRLSLIVALSNNRVIGRGGQLPWRLSADLRRFKQLTMGHHLIMGRKTYESIGRLLPGRTSIVVTRRLGYAAPGGLVAHSLPEALRLAAADDEAFVIGGEEIYCLALPRVERIYMTRVDVVIGDGDTFFSELSEPDWRLVSRETHAVDDKNQYDYRFEIYDRLQTRKETE